MSFIATLLVTALATAAAIWLVPGISAVGGPIVGPLVVALMLALVNSLVKPIVRAISMPVNVITLGLFSLVVNALMLMLASWLSTAVFNVGISISGFWAAFFGALIISVVSTIIGALTDTETVNDLA